MLRSLFKFIWRIISWGFLLLVAVMTAFRLFAPDTHWTSDPGMVYEIPLAFFYAILLAIILQRRTSLSIAAWPLAFVVMYFAYVAYLEILRSTYWAYSLTIEVETPEGLKSGSSVARVQWSRIDLKYRYFGPSCSLSSEATVVDLGARGRLIALLPSSQRNERCMVVPNLVGDRQPPLKLDDLRQVNLDDLHQVGRLLPVPPDLWPTMIRFKDTSGPYYDAEKLDPAALDRSFGTGVRLKGVTVTILNPGTWPFNSWGWPAFLAGVEIPRSRILETIPPLNVPFGKGLKPRPGGDINRGDFVQGEAR